jgi:hypothetical protein
MGGLKGPTQPWAIRIGTGPTLITQITVQRKYARIGAGIHVGRDLKIQEPRTMRPWLL